MSHKRELGERKSQSTILSSKLLRLPARKCQRPIQRGWVISSGSEFLRLFFFVTYVEP